MSGLERCSNLPSIVETYNDVAGNNTSHVTSNEDNSVHQVFNGNYYNGPVDQGDKFNGPIISSAPSGRVNPNETWNNGTCPPVEERVSEREAELNERLDAARKRLAAKKENRRLKKLEEELKQLEEELKGSTEHRDD